MFTLEELQQHIDAYRNARTSRRELFDWFEAHSFDAYDEASLRPICAAIDSAFSEFLYDDIGEDALRAELANAVRSFAPHVVEGLPYYSGFGESFEHEHAVEAASALWPYVLKSGRDNSQPAKFAASSANRNVPSAPFEKGTGSANSSAVVAVAA